MYFSGAVSARGNRQEYNIANPYTCVWRASCAIGEMFCCNRCVLHSLCTSFAEAYSWTKLKNLYLCCCHPDINDPEMSVIHPRCAKFCCTVGPTFNDVTCVRNLAETNSVRASYTLLEPSRNLYASEMNQTYVSLLLEMFSNIIQYQYTGNAHLIYAIVRRQEVRVFPIMRHRERGRDEGKG